MKTFAYIVQDEIGLHARPAGKLVKLARAFTSSIMVEHVEKEKTADATRIMALMALSIKYGSHIVFSIDGEDETSAYSAIQVFCRENL